MEENEMKFATWSLWKMQIARSLQVLIAAFQTNTQGFKPNMLLEKLYKKLSRCSCSSEKFLGEFNLKFSSCHSKEFQLSWKLG